jgi:hypothetical protein
LLGENITVAKTFPFITTVNECSSEYCCIGGFKGRTPNLNDKKKSKVSYTGLTSGVTNLKPDI